MHACMHACMYVCMYVCGNGYVWCMGSFRCLYRCMGTWPYMAVPNNLPPPPIHGDRGRWKPNNANMFMFIIINCIIIRSSCSSSSSSNMFSIVPLLFILVSLCLSCDRGSWKPNNAVPCSTRDEAAFTYHVYICIYIYIYVYMYVYVYIYIYIC